MKDEYVKMCECGCGKAAPIAKGDDNRRGQTKGQQLRFVNGHNQRGMTGAKSNRWSGGRSITTDGRYKVHKPEHQRAGSNGYVYQSILIAEKAFGKSIPIGARVHHVDSNEGNDKNNNLVICESCAYHLFLHQRKRAYDACGNPKWRKCCFCKEYDKLENLHITPQGASYHTDCNREYRKAYYVRRGK